MEFAASVRAQVERDEHALAALYAHQAEALARRRDADEELVRATANARAAAMDLETLNCLVAGRLELIARQNVTRSPIQRLPQDVLVLVFMQQTSPFIVASVCRAWRHIALDVPKLWTSIQLDAEENVQREMEYLEAMSHRSQRLSLSICIDAPAKVDADAMRMLEIALPNVIARADRLLLSQLPGSAVGMGFEYSILKFLRLPTPRLRHLSISMHVTHHDSSDLLPYTPVLETIDMLYPIRLRDLTRADLSALRKFRSSCPLESADLALLGALAPNLKLLDIGGILNDEVFSPLVLSPFASLEHLRVGSIRVLSCFPPDFFPTVTSLDIKTCYVDSLPLPQLPQLQLLRSLQLSAEHSYPAIPLFRQFAQIEILIITEIYESTALWADMTMPQNVQVLPRLRTLVLEYLSDESGDEIALIKFLEARAALGQDGENSPIPLEKLVVRDRWSVFPQWAFPRLEACVRTLVIEDQKACVRTPSFFYEDRI